MVHAGFVRDEDYLKPSLNPDYEEGESGFIDIEEARDAIDEERQLQPNSKAHPRT